MANKLNACLRVDANSALPLENWHVLVHIELNCSLLFDGEVRMADDGRVVTAKLPDDLVSQMDAVADRIDRTKSWIVRQAVSEWLAEEQRRYELTLEALQSVDEGRAFSQEEIEKHFAARRKARSRAARAA
ncbi:MAG TPA: ribbon-helix-helix domain-containing protein [Gemmatimonadaceae bacterium]|nr:ribbon-helix-helix domain-containing protein [Gemmatimonadaceae bacterium]